MREILFRGKRKDNGEWVEGYFVHCKSDFDEESRRTAEIIPRNADRIYKGEYSAFDVHEVILKTVGQFTELTDKNCKKIFEGDIVKITDEIVDLETFAYIEFGNPNGQYNWGWQLVPLQKKPFAVDILHWVDMEETGAFIEVIGNIHDNPELLEGE